jgi:prolyl oligopeptidase
LKITPHEGDVQHATKAFSRDSKRLYYTTDGHGEFTQAWSCDLASRQHVVEIAADWDVLTVGFSESGRYRVSTTNEDARTVLSVLDAKSGQRLQLPRLPKGDITGVKFSPARPACVLRHHDRAPPNLYCSTWARARTRSSAARSTRPSIPRISWTAASFATKASTALAIPAILYQPRQASATSKVPALVWVHGGPGGQSRLGYSAVIQHLVNHGYAVLAVNNRGSSGYGKSFFHQDDRKHGEGDLQDCVQARTYLAGLDWVDGSRVGIIGGSYGGYMVLAGAGVCAAGVRSSGSTSSASSNWQRTLESIPPWWGAFRDGLYAEMGDSGQGR